MTLFSCDRVKKKGQDVVHKAQEKAGEAKQKVVNKRDELIDKVFPSYDADKPDTESNKRRFKDHLQTELTADVSNIYCYGDFLGIDYKVLFTFQCDKSTIDRIVKAKKMQLMDGPDNGLISALELKWWDEKKISTIHPYKVGKEYEYWEYLWYDEKSRTAYYEEFSL